MCKVREQIAITMLNEWGTIAGAPFYRLAIEVGAIGYFVTFTLAASPLSASTVTL